MVGKEVRLPFDWSFGNVLPFAGVASWLGALPGSTCSSSLSEPDEIYGALVIGVRPPDSNEPDDAPLSLPWPL